MNNDFLWNLQQVVDGIPRGVLDERAKRSFLYPHEGIWPEDPDRAVAVAETIYRELGESRKVLFLSVCLASFLLNPQGAPGVGEWLQAHGALEKVWGIEAQWEEIVSWSWGRVALPGADQAERWHDRIVYALLGVSRGGGQRLRMPGWCDHVLGREAREATETAASLAAAHFPGNTVLFWPQLDPAGSEVAVNGASLGLPIYLSLCSLAQNGSIPSILATGRIDRNGKLHEVTGLEEKYKLAHKKNFPSFLYPLLPGVKPLEDTGKVHPLGVGTLEQAASIWMPEAYRQADSGYSAWARDAFASLRAELGRGKRKALLASGVCGLLLTALIAVAAYRQWGGLRPGGGRGIGKVQPQDAPATVAVNQARKSPRQELPVSPGTVPRQKNVPPSPAATVAEPHSPLQARPVDLDAAVEDRMLNRYGDNATTYGCFRAAKEMMLDGRQLSARAKYEECFQQNSEFLDTHLDYQKLLKGLDGYAGAKATYGAFHKKTASLTVSFATLLLNEPSSRFPLIKQFNERNPGYAPAYYWMGMDCFEISGSDAYCSRYLLTFIDLAKAGKVDKYFVSKYIAKDLVTEAKEKVADSGKAVVGVPGQ